VIHHTVVKGTSAVCVQIHWHGCSRNM